MRLFRLIAKQLKLPAVMLFALLLPACPDSPLHHNYDNDINFPVGTIPETVTNFTSVNSAYDDFNSGPPPMLGMNFPLYFSSNRATQGGTFDIETVQVVVSFSQHDGWFSMGGYIDYMRPQWPGADSSSNEYGPFIMDMSDGRTIYSYASDTSGNLNIYYTVRPGDGGIIEAAALNSASDDAYLTTGPDNAIYFTTNRGGDFDIFRAEIPVNADIPAWLASSGTNTIVRVDGLSTTSNDKCPYINGKLLVFTSDRPGGYGGYDLYYSTYGPDGWSAPVNFGPAINTQYDEYRPAVVYAADFTNDLMLFSSNRPGGLGGFDLYYVGIPKMTK